MNKSFQFNEILFLDRLLCQGENTWTTEPKTNLNNKLKPKKIS